VNAWTQHDFQWESLCFKSSIQLHHNQNISEYSTNKRAQERQIQHNQTAHRELNFHVFKLTW
jgi:hypothetical protein